MPDFRSLRRYLTIPSPSAARIKHEVDEELRLHIDMRAEALERAGVSPRDARDQAMREFGDLAEATHYCASVDRQSERRRRTGDWISELRHDVRHAVRTLRRAPRFAAATIVTLALAIGASTAVYGVLHTYLIRPLPFPDADRLVSIIPAPTLDRSSRGPSLRNVDWTRVDSLFAATAAWDLDGFTIVGEQPENVTGAWVSSGYAAALGLRPAIGRGFRPDEYRDEVPIALISHGLWMRRFAGDSSVIGSTITIHSTDRPNGAPLVTIVGVLSPDFWPIQWRESELLRPLPPERNWMPTLARLKPGVSRAQTERRLDAIVRAQIDGAIDPSWHMMLMPALSEHSARVRPVLTAVFGAALFMFLAACGSVAGALVARTASRRNELAVRLALGGSPGRIIRQLLTESAVLALVAGVLGLVIAYVLLDTSGPLVEQQLGTTAPGGPTALRPTLPIMGLSVVASALAGVALGLVPALTFLRLDRTAGTAAVFGTGRGSSARSSAHVRRTLIAAQIAVAMVLLFGAGLMFRSIVRMSGVGFGFRIDGVVKATVLLPQARYPDSAAKQQVMDRVLSRIAEVDGVTGVASVFPYPFRGAGAGRFPVIAEGSGSDEESAPRAGVHTVSPGYFDVLDIQVRTGRGFRTTDDQAAPLVVVVSEALARRMSPNGDVIGRRIRVRVPHVASFDDRDERPWRTVVGVVADTKKDFAPDEPPDVYVPYAQNPRALQSIVVRTDKPEATIIEGVRRATGSVDPALALSGVSSMSDVIASHGGQRRGLTVLLGAFAVFALGLSALALYASLSYTVVQRRSELAVRLAVGASARSILRLVILEGLATAAIGVVVGVLASVALGRVLVNQVYGVGTGDPATLVSISLVLTLAAIAACAAPALRASRTDPALALRE